MRSHQVVLPWQLAARTGAPLAETQSNQTRCESQLLTHLKVLCVDLIPALVSIERGTDFRHHFGFWNVIASGPTAFRLDRLPAWLGK